MWAARFGRFSRPEEGDNSHADEDEARGTAKDAQPRPKTWIVRAEHDVELAGVIIGAGRHHAPDVGSQNQQCRAQGYRDSGDDIADAPPDPILCSTSRLDPDLIPSHQFPAQPGRVPRDSDTTPWPGF